MIVVFGLVLIILTGSVICLGVWLFTTVADIFGATLRIERKLGTLPSWLRDIYFGDEDDET